MKKLLHRLDLSVKHLQTLDNVLQSKYEEYRNFAHKIESLPHYQELLKEVYTGGRGRQMILGDLLEYILTGRAYYFATKGEDYMKTFVKMLMYLCNLLLVMENISVLSRLRKDLLMALENSIGKQLLFEKNQDQNKFEELKKYEGFIIPADKMGKDYERVFDTLLPKRVGIVPELLVYSYFIRKNYGYIIPLLTHQRILGMKSSIIAPDFLLLRRKGEVVGLEVGAGPTRKAEFKKQRQLAEFSSATSIPVIVVGIGSPEQPQPYRCGKCKMWITYCEKAIELCSENMDRPGQDHIDCSNCERRDFCENKVYYGPARDYFGKTKVLRYHYRCVQDEIKEEDAGLIGLVPAVYGIEKLVEEI